MYTEELTLMQPPRIEYGPGTLSRLAPWIQENDYGRVFVLCDKSVSAAFEPLKERLSKAAIEAVLSTDVIPEPKQQGPLAGEFL